MYHKCEILDVADAQRWPIGFDGSVRLGWKARCMDCGSDMTPDAFSSSLLRRHAAFGFRFLSVAWNKDFNLTTASKRVLSLLNSALFSFFQHCFDSLVYIFNFTEQNKPIFSPPSLQKWKHSVSCPPAHVGWQWQRTDLSLAVPGWGSPPRPGAAPAVWSAASHSSDAADTCDPAL